MRAAQMGQRDAAQQQQEQRRQEAEARDEQRRAIVRNVLEPEALERLNRIGLVKPEKQTRLEELIFANVQRGAIKQKIDEGTFVNLLHQIEAAAASAVETDCISGVVSRSGIQFKRTAFEDDSDIDLDDLE